MLFSNVVNPVQPSCFDPLNMRFDPSKVASKIKANTHLHAAINRAMFVTKVLRMQKIRKDEEAEKLVPSSNLFDVFNWRAGMRVVEDVIGEAKGLLIRKATSSDTQSKKIYSRKYKDRAQRETMMDIRHQGKIKKAFAGAKRVHILIELDKITITPIFEKDILDKCLSVSFDGQNKKRFYQSLAKALHVINQFRFAQIQMEVLHKDASKIIELLDVQLRRKGYKTECVENTVTSSLLNKQLCESVSLDKFTGYKPAPVSINTQVPLSTFVACTGGVDAFLLEQDDFVVNNLLDFTPIESRDWKKVSKKGEITTEFHDKRELCLLNALVNTSKANKVALFNEDLFLSDMKRVNALSNQHNFLHISFCCQAFTLMKSKSDHAQSRENLTTSQDMFVAGMELINESNVASLLVENVVPFGKSHECEIFKAGLSLMGYKINCQNIKASEHNCYTNRDRYYLFASKLDATFEFPLPQPRTVNAWEDIIKHQLMGPFQKERGKWANKALRDVSHTKAIQNAIETKRDRFMTSDKDICSTIPRCQSRQVKDALYISHEGAYFYPKVQMQRDLMGIPEGFDLSLQTSEVSTEIQGNSVEAPQHSAIIAQVKKHIKQGVKYFTSSRKQFSQLAFEFDCA